MSPILLQTVPFSLVCLYVLFLQSADTSGGQVIITTEFPFRRHGSIPLTADQLPALVSPLLAMFQTLEIMYFMASAIKEVKDKR